MPARDTVPGPHLAAAAARQRRQQASLSSCYPTNFNGNTMKRALVAAGETGPASATAPRAASAVGSLGRAHPLWIQGSGRPVTSLTGRKPMYGSCGVTGLQAVRVHMCVSLSFGAGIPTPSGQPSICLLAAWFRPCQRHIVLPGAVMPCSRPIPATFIHAHRFALACNLPHPLPNPSHAPAHPPI